MYVQCSWLFLLYECLWTTVLSSHIFLAFITMVSEVLKTAQNSSCGPKFFWTIRKQMDTCSLTDMSAVPSMIRAWCPASLNSFVSDKRTSWAIISSISFKMSWESHLYLVWQCNDCNSEMSLVCSSRSSLKLLPTLPWPRTAKPWHAKLCNEDNAAGSAFLASFISFCFRPSQAEAAFTPRFVPAAPLKDALCKCEAPRP